MKHTPTPWAVLQKDKWHEMNTGNAPSSVFHIGDYTVVTDSPSYEFHESDEDDAAFIVRAVNSHERMVTALEMARRQLVTLGGEAGEKPDADRIHAWVLNTIDEALEAAAPPVEQAKTEVVG